MVFGTFDIVHAGHIQMFKEGRKYGNNLVVVVARDVNVEKNKGYNPLHNEKERTNFLKHIRLVDRVVLGDKTDVYKVVKRIKPDVVALGYDQKIYVDHLKEVVDSLGTKIVKLPKYRTDKFKSSKIKQYLSKMI